MDGEIRYAMTARQQLAFLIACPVAAGERYLLGKTPGAITWSVVVALLSLFLVRSRRSSTLSPAGITVWNWRTKLIPWSAITDVETTHGPLSTTFVRLRYSNGKSEVLRAPQTGWLQRDPEFGAKAATIRAWWEHYSAGAAVGGAPTG